MKAHLTTISLALAFVFFMLAIDSLRAGYVG